MSLLNRPEPSGLGSTIIAFEGAAISTRRWEKRLREGLEGVLSIAHAKWKEIGVVRINKSDDALL